VSLSAATSSALLFAFLMSPSSLRQTFYDRVLGDFDEHSSFVALNVTSAHFSGRVIIENADLHYFLSKTKRLGGEGYKTYVTNLLSNRGILRVGNQDLQKWGFVKVDEVDSVNAWASKGLDQFLNHYFTGDVLTPGVAYSETNAVINRLFEWRIATKVDDDSGFVVVVR
jgi:hypothetical protein